MVARKVVWSKPPWSQPVVPLVIQVAKLDDQFVTFETLDRRVQGSKRVIPLRKVKHSEAFFNVRHSGLYSAKKAVKSVNRESKNMHASKSKSVGKPRKVKSTKVKSTKGVNEAGVETLSVSKMLTIIEQEMKQIKKSLREVKDKDSINGSRNKGVFIKEINQGLSNIKRNVCLASSTFRQRFPVSHSREEKISSRKFFDPDGLHREILQGIKRQVLRNKVKHLKTARKKANQKYVEYCCAHNKPRCTPLHKSYERAYTATQSELEYAKTSSTTNNIDSTNQDEREVESSLLKVVSTKSPEIRSNDQGSEKCSTSDLSEADISVDLPSSKLSERDIRNFNFKNTHKSPLNNENISDSQCNELVTQDALAETNDERSLNTESKLNYLSTLNQLNSDELSDTAHERRTNLRDELSKKVEHLKPEYHTKYGEIVKYLYEYAFDRQASRLLNIDHEQVHDENDDDSILQRARDFVRDVNDGIERRQSDEEFAEKEKEIEHYLKAFVDALQVVVNEELSNSGMDTLRNLHVRLTVLANHGLLIFDENFREYFEDVIKYIDEVYAMACKCKEASREKERKERLKLHSLERKKKVTQMRAMTAKYERILNEMTECYSKQIGESLSERSNRKDDDTSVFVDRQQGLNDDYLCPHQAKVEQGYCNSPDDGDYGDDDDNSTASSDNSDSQVPGKNKEKTSSRKTTDNNPKSQRNKIPKTIPIGGGDDGSGDDSSSSSCSSSNSSSDSSSDTRKRKGKAYKNRKKNRKEKDKNEFASQLSRTSGVTEKSVNKVDKMYRSILKSLLKCAKNYNMNELSFSNDPKQKRDRFLRWVTDLKSVLSCDYRTAGILDDYPAELDPFQDINIDRAIKSLMISATKGAAKELVTRAESGFEGLIDLKRNCAQATIVDEHRERRKMLNIRQAIGEKATDYLYRVRKQILACQSSGCKEFDTKPDNTIVTSIILEGMNVLDTYYSATVAQLKSNFRTDNKSVSLILLEEMFFAMDAEKQLRKYETTQNTSRQDKKFTFTKRGGTREHAKYIKTSSSLICHHCGKPGHKKPDCQDLKAGKPAAKNIRSIIAASITCYNCGETGHYSKNCKRPRKLKEPTKPISDKVVRFESAHVARKGDEHCNVCLEFAMPVRRTFSRNVSTPVIAFAHGDFANWLLDSGASSHFTPDLLDLLDCEELDHPIYIEVADGTRLRATHQGVVELHYTSDEGRQILLRLMRVLYVPNLQTRLFSIESFISTEGCSALFQRGSVKLTIPGNHSVTIQLPHVPPGTYLTREIQDLRAFVALDDSFNLDIPGFRTWVHHGERVDDAIVVTLVPHPDCEEEEQESYYVECSTTQHHIMMAREHVLNDLSFDEKLRLEQKDPCSGGDKSDVYLASSWKEKEATNRRRMEVELAHNIFGHRAISSLMNASNQQVWDDLQLVMNGDTYCDSCKIAFAKKSNLSKRPMRFGTTPLENVFIDLIPSPGIMRNVKEWRQKYFLFIVDPVSKHIEKLNVEDKTPEQTIMALDKWRNSLIKQDFKFFIYLRSDAGSNFTSDKFKTWCVENKVTLTIAGVDHQEQNAFAEACYKTATYMARKMMVHARLPISMFHPAIDYAIKILRILPTKNLVDIDGKLTTPYEVLYNRKPRVQRFKVFGCPVTFKRYEPYSNGVKQTKFITLQQASRGIFVGFPPDQAGWLIYSPVKLGPGKGSHLVISSDVSFDQQFISGIHGLDIPFKGAQPERRIPKHNDINLPVTERTGDASNLTDMSVSHWGEKITYDTFQPFVLPNPKDTKASSSLVFDEQIFDDDDEDEEMPTLIEHQDDDSSCSSSTSDSDSTSEELHNDPSDNWDFIFPDDFNDDENHRYPTRHRIRQHSNMKQAFKATETSSCIHEDTIQNKKLNQQIPLLRQITMRDTDNDFEQAFQIIEEAALQNDIPITRYLPEPRNRKELMRCSNDIKKEWLKAISKEIKTVIETQTFRDGDPQEGDEIIPAILIYKAKVTSKGFLDKLKVRLVARGDLQLTNDEPENLWSPCIFARTFKMFVAHAVKEKRPIKQLDFIAAFCQGKMRSRLFVQLPKEYREDVETQFQQYFDKPLLLDKSIYGLTIAAKSFFLDLSEWLLKEKPTSEEGYKFIQSPSDPSLFIYRNGNDFLYLCIYVDDTCYFGSSDEIEATFEKAISKVFNLELQGHTHWFIGTRLYREKDGSYSIDQENYIHHLLNRYCSKDSPWGLPPMKNTPAPETYSYSKDNRPKNDTEKKHLSTLYPDLSMPSAVSSLLYAALNTRPDILWITNKLAKSANYPGKNDFEALLHVFGYLRKYPDYGIKFYANLQESPIYQILDSNKIEPTDIIAFSDSSWQDCLDTGRSTCGHKIFVQGGLIDAQSCLPVPVALSSAEAEYMAACNAGAMVCHLRDIKYDLEYLGTPEYNDLSTNPIPSLLLTDNKATVSMSKNAKISSKNRHIRRRWHFVRYGVTNNLFNLKWITKEDQLADEMTKTQSAKKIQPHFIRTLVKISDKVKGYRGNTIGNR